MIRLFSVIHTKRERTRSRDSERRTSAKERTRRKEPGKAGEGKK